MNRREFSRLSLASLSAALPLSAFAQAKYPERPIKLVVPFSAGGVNDIVGRQWAERMREPLGSVFVENQGGGGGTPAVMEVKRADADGKSFLPMARGLSAPTHSYLRQSLSSGQHRQSAIRSGRSEKSNTRCQVIMLQRCRPA